jgi:hypothetical protein
MKPLTLNLTPTVSATPRVTFFIPKPSHALPDPAKTPTYKLPDHPCAARDAQVEWLVAAPPALRGASRLPWPKPSPHFLLQWEARHEAHGSLSTGYKATQERMLFLGDVPMQHRFARFEAECHIRRLAPTTAMTYYNAWTTAAAALGLPRDAAAETRINRLLKSRATRFPVAFPAPLTLGDVRLCRARFADCPSMITLIMVSWTLGQRLGDTLQWAAVDLHTEMDGRLVITVRRGKTLGVTPPYVLALHKGAS